MVPHLGQVVLYIPPPSGNQLFFFDFSITRTNIVQLVQVNAFHFFIREIPLQAQIAVFTVFINIAIVDVYRLLAVCYRFGVDDDVRFQFFAFVCHGIE